MLIYMITNKINGKIYIGKTIESAEMRWKRHIRDSKTATNHFGRAIQKYGESAFELSILQDNISDLEQLNALEKFYIAQYHSLDSQIGYNSSEGGDGGNTYINKTNEEMIKIKAKIRESFSKRKNPNISPVKCKNVETNEELHFESCTAMARFFGEKSHTPFSARAKGKTLCLYKKTWAIAYENEEYSQFSKEKCIRRSKKIRVCPPNEQVWKDFVSYASAERFYELPIGTFSGHAYELGNNFFVKGYHIQIVK